MSHRTPTPICLSQKVGGGHGAKARDHPWQGRRRGGIAHRPVQVPRANDQNHLLRSGHVLDQP
eukprot:15473314-Alexandrium_andersonii.AAC.1